MPVTLPYDLTVPVKREIRSAELMGNYNALKDKFSAGIVDADCSTNMNLNGAKILANTMPGNRIIDGSITATQIAPLAILAGAIKTANFDWVYSGAVGYDQHVAQNTGIGPADGIPLRVEVRRAGPPLEDLAVLVIQLHFNSTSGTWYINLRTPSSGFLPFSLAAVTFRMVYVPIS